MSLVDLYRGRRVLVTGHTGFKGAWLSHWLLELGASVTGCALPPSSTPAIFETLGLSSRLSHHVLDIQNLEALRKLVAQVKPEMVFHLAGQALVRLSYDDPVETFSTNAMGTMNVLEAVKHTPSVKVVLVITSDKCYENRGWPYGYREVDQLGGRDPYSASKACAELICKSYAASYFVGDNSPCLTTARAGNVVGGGDWSVDRLIPDCVRAWSNGDSVLIRNPDSYRPWQHVVEPLAGYLWLGALAAKNRTSLHGQAFNFGPSASAKNHTALNVVGKLSDYWGKGRWHIAEQNDRQKQEASILRLNCDKALSLLEWEATLDFDKALQLTVDWYQQFYQGHSDMAAYTTQQIDFYQGTACSNEQRWASELGDD